MHISSLSRSLAATGSQNSEGWVVHFAVEETNVLEVLGYIILALSLIALLYALG